MSMLFQNKNNWELSKTRRKISSISSMAKLKDSRSNFITRWRVFYIKMRAARARWNYANFNHHHPSFLFWKKTSHTSFYFFETSKLVSPQFLLFTLFRCREKNGEKTFQLTPINFVYKRLPDFRRNARIAMARCTRETKFEAVQRHYIKIYQSNFLVCYKKFIPL